MNCPKCSKSEMVLIQDSPSVSFAGIIGAFLFIVGLVTLLAAPMAGLIIIVVGILIAIFARGKIQVMVCPACKHRIKL